MCRPSFGIGLLDRRFNRIYILKEMAIGSMTWLMDMGDSSMRMEMYMKVNGSMIRLMAKANTCILMGQLMKVIGAKTNNMDMVWRNGLMVLNMKETMRWARRRALATSNGQMAQTILESSMM